MNELLREYLDGKPNPEAPKETATPPRPDQLTTLLQERGWLDAPEGGESARGSPEMRALKSAYRQLARDAKTIREPADRARILNALQRFRGSLAVNLGDAWTESD